MAFRTEKHRTEKMIERMARRIRSVGGGALALIVGNLTCWCRPTSAGTD